MKRFFLALLLTIICSQASAEIYVVVNAWEPDTPLTYSDVERIFKCHKTSWSNGKEILHVLPNDPDKIKKICPVVKRTTEQLEKTLRLKWFEGKIRRRVLYLTEADALKLVANNKGSIAFVSDRPSESDITGLWCKSLTEIKEGK